MPFSSELITASGSLSKILLTSPDNARAEIYLHGAHLTSWIPAGGEEQLFLSRKSEFRPGAAIRGGVPIIFPQFSNLGLFMRHGFARITPWAFVDAEAVADNAVAATFQLRDSDATRKIWPYSFLAEFTATLSGQRLKMSFAVTNNDSNPFSFTSALHTYFRVTDVGKTVIENLRGVRYRDQVLGKDEVQSKASLKFNGEVNRIYFNAPPRLSLREGNRVTEIQATGFPDVVVWNPDAKNGAALSDLEPEGYRRFVCVEAAVIGMPVSLAPGES